MVRRGGGVRVAAVTPAASTRTATAAAVVAVCLVTAPAAAAVAAAAATTSAAWSSIVTTGEMRVWHPVTLDIPRGPWASETARRNPFMTYRLTTTYTSADSGGRYVVPCFWAADGMAAHTGASAGSVWRCLFTPDAPGEWRWSMSFKQGPGVAVRTDGAGAPVRPFDGRTGSFVVGPSNNETAGGRDFRQKGRLRPVPGQRYMRFDNGDWFLKHGTDSPENFFGYREFDNTPKGRHLYGPHIMDWLPGDPTWGADHRGKGIIGALSYLASVGVNSVYAMPLTVGGDAKDTFPWVTERGVWRYDVSKLAQWDIVLDHMDAQGVALHFILSETENEELMERADRGVLGHGFSTSRRLYYRELIARFGHHQGIMWNLGEENGWKDGSGRGQYNTDWQRKVFLAHLAALEPYGALLSLHTFPADKERIFTPLLGDASALTGASLQVAGWPNVHNETLTWVLASREAAKPWVVSVDEIGGTGALPDAVTPDHHRERRDVLWGALTAGAAGVEWYNQAGDQSMEDFRGHANLWATTDRTLRLLRAQRVPFWAMDPADWVVQGRNNWALASPDIILVFLRWGGAATVRLAPSTAYAVGWFDPRLGAGVALEGARVIVTTTGGATRIGVAPRDARRDWALLVRRVGPVPTPSPPTPPSPPLPSSSAAPTPPPPLRVTPPAGPFSFYVVDPRSGVDVAGPLPPTGGSLHRAALPPGFSLRAAPQEGLPPPPLSPTTSIRGGAGGRGSVVWELNGQVVRVERVPPYLIAGDHRGTIYPWRAAPCGGAATIAARWGAGGDASTIHVTMVC